MMFRLCVSFAVFCVLCCKFSVLSYPQGAPVRTESCINLQPIHMDPLTSQQVPNQQGTTRPYRILVSQQQYQTCTSNQQCGLQPLQVSIQGQGGLFRGFIVQARTPNGGSRSWGQFIPLQTGDSKVIQCQNGLTLTHTANNDKNIVRFAWIPEPGMREQVQFVATVVQNLRTIYPGVYSAQLRPVGVSAIRVPVMPTTKLAPPTTMSSATREPPTTTVSPTTTPKPTQTTNTPQTTTSFVTTTKTTTTTTTTPSTTTTYSPMTSTAIPLTSSTKRITTTTTQPLATVSEPVFNNAPFKTAGIISFVTSVIAILL
ncbi:hepatitis A virus cellular receptor 1-like isoform X3 [Crassostrea angulata]|uniref:hepatitis A virus cellular receptor 1-like isoform X3 n=1 Tax=Magallana angulata TaxID=2784310 RepID=UPI0022B1DF21|nr:hepatitis A virus cellular receptor 1-like isoform X3 [Crassostrea angulata]